MECELFEHMKLLETRLLGFTCKGVLELTYQIAEVNGIVHNFYQETKLADPEWQLVFKRKNPDIF